MMEEASKTGLIMEDNNNGRGSIPPVVSAKDEGEGGRESGANRAEQDRQEDGRLPGGQQKGFVMSRSYTKARQDVQLIKRTFLQHQPRCQR